MSNQRLKALLQAIDKVNANDPRSERVGTKDVPQELLYGQRMSKTLADFAPKSSEYLQIAARAQHIERWRSPRSDYPEGRAGYKKWRSQLSLFHAERTAELMRELAYSDEEIEKVKYLLQKRQLKRNPETQTLEDVICLVFLQYYFVDFAAKHEQTKLIDIVQKTWAKMSVRGQQEAMKIDFPKHLLQILQTALS